MSLEREFRVKAIKDVFWDYNVDPDALDKMLQDNLDHVGGIYRNELFIKLLNMYSWHKVRKIIPEQLLKVALDEKVINGLFPRSLRDKYRYVRSLL